MTFRAVALGLPSSVFGPRTKYAPHAGRRTRFAPGTRSDISSREISCRAATESRLLVAGVGLSMTAAVSTGPSTAGRIGRPVDLAEKSPSGTAADRVTANNLRLMAPPLWRLSATDINWCRLPWSSQSWSACPRTDSFGGEFTGCPGYMSRKSLREGGRRAILISRLTYVIMLDPEKPACRVLTSDSGLMRLRQRPEVRKPAGRRRSGSDHSRRSRQHWPQ